MPNPADLRSSSIRTLAILIIISITALTVSSQQIWAWGSNFYGEIDPNNSTDIFDPPFPVNLNLSGCGSNFTHLTITLGPNFVGGYTWSTYGQTFGVCEWGTNANQVISDNTSLLNLRMGPIQYDEQPYMLPATGVFTTAQLQLAITPTQITGYVSGWGYRAGDPYPGSTGFESLPNFVPSFYSCGTQFCVFQVEGSWWAGGANDRGQLGQNAPIQSAEIYESPMWLDPVNYTVILGDDFGYALAPNGSFYAWGANDVGQLGPLVNYTLQDQNYPVDMNNSWATGQEIIQWIASSANSIVLTNTTIWVWGDNSFGQLGAEYTSLPFSSAPLSIGVESAFSGFIPVQVSTVHHTMLALCGNGVVYYWGASNTLDGTNSFSATIQPLSIPSNPFISALQSTSNYSVGFRSYTLWMAEGVAPPFVQKYPPVSVPVSVPVAIPTSVPIASPVNPSCPPGSQPSPDAVCQQGVWHFPGPVVVNGTLTITSPVIINGTFTVPAGTTVTLNPGTFNTGSPLITVNGTVTLTGKVNVYLNSTISDSIIQDGGGSVTLIEATLIVDSGSVDSNYTTSTKKCQTLSTTVSTSSDQTTLSLLFSVGQLNCYLWWIILLCVVNFVLILLLIFALLYKYNHKFRRMVSPFSGSNN